MGGFRIEGAGGVVVESNASGDLKVGLPVTTDPTRIGMARMMVQRDDGTLSGSADIGSLMSSVDNRLSVGVDTSWFEAFFTAAAQDTGKWQYYLTTMTMTQSGGSLLTNAISSTVSGNGCILRSNAYIPLTGSGSTKIEFVNNVVAAPLANQVFLCGWAYNITVGSSPTDGVWFQLTSAGLIGVCNYNGSSTQSGVLRTPAQMTADIGLMKRWTLLIDERQVEFWYGGYKVGEMATPSANSQPCMMVNNPIIIQQYNSGTVSGSPHMQVKVGSVSANVIDMNINKPYSHIQAGMGRMASQAQEGATMASTALYTNNLAAGAGAAMTNTTAALGSGLGGQFSALPTLAAGSDGIVCNYQVPLGSVNQPALSLYITGIRVQGLITTALTGGPLLYAYSLAYGHTAASLATTEIGSFTTGATKLPRRLPLGYETFVVTAPVGTVGQSVLMPLASPICVNPGEMVALVAKNLGTVTTLGVCTFLVTFDGYFA